MIPIKQGKFLNINYTFYSALKEALFESHSLTNFSSKFLTELMINVKEENFSLNITLLEGKYFFSGYPSGNYLKIICKVIELWAEKGGFPISFQCLANLDVIK